MTFNTDIDLGSVLMSKQLVTESQLQICLKKQHLEGGYLSQHLIECGFLKDADLTTCLTCQYGYCYIPLDSYSISEAAIGAIPPKFLRDYCVIPIEKSDKLLTVVMADPLNKGVVDVLRQMSGCEIIVFVSSRQEIQNALKRYYALHISQVNLDRFQDDSVLRDDVKANSYIHSGSYSGPSRRRYCRSKIGLDAEYYLYPYSVKTKIKNISMNGICFETYLPLAQGSQLALNIKLNDQEPAYAIETVVEVARCVTMNRNNDDSLSLYEFGGFFNFVSEENQYLLAELIKNPPRG
jgi:hypothetical protein